MLAFSPLTTLRASDYDSTPFAPSARVRALNAASFAQSAYFDLLDVLETTSPTGRLCVVYPQHSERDRWHAERLRGAPQVTLRPIDFGAHNVVRHLRGTGDLQRLLAEAVVDAEGAWRRKGSTS